MGKAQSKRSVDITTEIPKNVDEGTIGKMGKIEDVDELNQAETKLNGDNKAYANDLAGDILATDVDRNEAENAKDVATEKQSSVEKINMQRNDDEVVAEPSVLSENQGIENGDSAPGEASVKITQETNLTAGTDIAEASSVPDSDEKKTTKQKVKKRWSFRSFSFNKKDKQKPAKKEEDAIKNGDCEKVLEENFENVVKVCGPESDTDNIVPEIAETDLPIKNDDTIIKTIDNEVNPVEANSDVVVLKNQDTTQEAKTDLSEDISSTAVPKIKAVLADVEPEVPVVPTVGNADSKPSLPAFKAEIKEDIVAKVSAIEAVDTVAVSSHCESITPPPLPSNPPPPQALLFAESAMSPQSLSSEETNKELVVVKPPADTPIDIERNEEVAPQVLLVEEANKNEREIVLAIADPTTILASETPEVNTGINTKNEPHLEEAESEEIPNDSNIISELELQLEKRIAESEERCAEATVNSPVVINIDGIDDTQIAETIVLVTDYISMNDHIEIQSEVSVPDNSAPLSHIIADTTSSDYAKNDSIETSDLSVKQPVNEELLNLEVIGTDQKLPLPSPPPPPPAIEKENEATTDPISLAQNGHHSIEQTNGKIYNGHSENVIEEKDKSLSEDHVPEMSENVFVDYVDKVKKSNGSSVELKEDNLQSGTGDYVPNISGIENNKQTVNQDDLPNISGIEIDQAEKKQGGVHIEKSLNVVGDMSSPFSEIVTVE